MTARRLMEQSVASMRRYKLRTTFMMLGSFVGVAALVFSVSLGQGVQVKVLRTIEQILGNASLVVIGGGSRMMGSPHGNAVRLTMDDLVAVTTEVPGIVDWDPQSELPGSSVRRGGSSATARVLGGSERWPRVWGREIARGESFDARAVSTAARDAVIGATVARDLFGDEDPIGAEIQIGAVSFRVIGVMERFGVDLHGMDRDDEIVVPISTLMRRLTNADEIGAGKLLLADASRTRETEGKVRDVLRRRHGLSRDVPDDFRTFSALQAQEMVSMIRRVLFLYVPLVAGVVLLVGGIVAAALMLGSVNERVAEIGLRRAVGAMPEDIRRQFMLETAITIVAGGTAGIFAGWFGTHILSFHLRLGGAFSWTAVAVSLVASVVTGFVAGVMPARRAAALDPADALR